ncbi:hypothetical protein U1Q18_003200, partial [Sarracenia purpurea var. burkii]
MDVFGSDRSKTLNFYAGSDPRPAQTGVVDREAPLKNFGTSMSSISFGFVATAILVSMFLIMAIFEHLFRPSPPSSPQDGTSRSMEKPRNPQPVSLSTLQTLNSVPMLNYL